MLGPGPGPGLGQEGTAQVAECMASLHNPWDRSLVLHRRRGTVHLPTKHLGVGAGREVQGHPQLHGEFEGSCHPKFILKSIFMISVSIGKYYPPL